MEKDIDYKKNKYFAILFLLIPFSALIFFNFDNYQIYLVLFLLIFFIFLFFLFPLLGLYLISLFLPITGFSFGFRSFEAPLIDLLSLIVLTSFFIRNIYLYFYYKSKDKIIFPLGWEFLLFFIVTLISGFLSYDIPNAVWYSFRWILFFYLSFVVLPFNIIKNTKVLKNSLILVVLGGLAVALMGFISLFSQDWSNSFFRVKTLFVFGEWVFGENYNLLAEFLTSVTFIIISLKYWIKNYRLNRILDILVGFFILVIFLTFGRTAWITISLQLILYFIIERFIIKKKKFRLKETILSISLVLFLISPFFIKMLTLQRANISSTENRILLTEISWLAFLEKPIFGHGSGSFTSLVGNDIRFVAKYGDPLDSHGFAQKILTENGILGLAFFLLFIFFIFRRIIIGLLKNKEDYKLLLPLFVGSFGAIFYQVFNTSYYKGRVWLPIALALIATEIISKNKKEKINDEQK